MTKKRLVVSWTIAFFCLALVGGLFVMREDFTADVTAEHLSKALTVYNTPFEKMRVGNEFDGGYVICSGLKYDGFLSGGIERDLGFETAFLQKHPHLICHAYDGSIDSLPPHRGQIVFHKKYIGGHNSETTSNLHHLIERHNALMVKMDIEGGEYEWLRSLSDDHMSRIAQLVIEFHYPHASSENFACLLRLQETHWLVHLHGNNCESPAYAQINNRLLPTVFECTYVSKRLTDNVGRSWDPIPGHLDARNCLGQPDMDVHHFY